MGGKDGDSRSDLDKWLESQRVEMDKIRQQFRDGLDKEIRTWKDDASSSLKGPFERFKDFIDSNFSTFAQGFKNFPSNLTELKAKMQQEREARRQEELDITRRWVGCDDSPDHIRMQVERSSAEDRQAVKDATYMLLREAFQRNQHVSPEKILNLYRDNEWSFGSLDHFATPLLSMGGACYYKNETVDNLPSTARWSWAAPKPQWLSVDWFKRSPYSPVRLEAHPDLKHSNSTALDTKWRAAFEDLLCAALDKPMMSQEKIGQRIPYGNPQSTYHGPGLDWMLSLQCRGILPPQLPSLYKPVRLFDGFDEVKRPRVAEFMHDMDSITADKSTRMYPLVRRDLELLMDEISIKSTPPTSALVIPQSPWRVPETEKDLYDDMPPYTDLVSSVKPLNVPTMTGQRYVDAPKAAPVLLDALEGGDLATATKCLDAYFDAHSDVYDLIYEAISDRRYDFKSMNCPPWYRNLGEALRKANFNNDKLSRAFGSDTARNDEEEEEVGYEEEYDEEYDDEYEEEYEEAYNQFPLKDKIEKRSLETETGSRVSDQKKDKQQKPDILSQLTTTHTTRMPDGTVTTKVVLKQRFADGREEVHESVQTSRDEASHQKPLLEKESGEKPPKKGWFWN